MMNLLINTGLATVPTQYEEEKEMNHTQQTTNSMAAHNRFLVMWRPIGGWAGARR
jgi:hypothetical protein